MQLSAKLQDLRVSTVVHPPARRNVAAVALAQTLRALNQFTPHAGNSYMKISSNSESRFTDMDVLAGPPWRLKRPAESSEVSTKKSKYPVRYTCCDIDDAVIGYPV
jgi:hypothetical protein